METTIKIYDSDSEESLVYSLSQDQENKEINIDVESEGNNNGIDYYFTIPAATLLKFLIEYQEQNNII